ncbi:MAG: DUF1007 family protein [Candidatus Muiribacteriota bacterium]
MKYLFFACLIFCTISAICHPHVWVEVNTRAYTSENELEKIKLKWTFDEMFSMLFEEDFNDSKDGNYTDEEKEFVKKTVFKNMSDYNYYTTIKIDGEEVNLTPEFEMDTENRILIFNFTYNINEKIKDESQNILISVFDEEFYHDIELSSPVFKVEGESSDKVDFKVQEGEFEWFYSVIEVEELVIEF